MKREMYVDGANAFLQGSDDPKTDIDAYLVENYPAAQNAVSNIASAINWSPVAAASFCLNLLETVNFAGTDDVKKVIIDHLNI